MNTYHYQPATPSIVTQIRQLEIGDRLVLLGGYVKRVKRSEYVLHAENYRTHARWGTAEEIAEDVAHFVTTGALPRPQGGPW